MAKKETKPLNSVERLIQSLGKRIENYKKNKARINDDFQYALAKEDQKIEDATLQLKALQKK